MTGEKPESKLAKEELSQLKTIGFFTLGFIVYVVLIRYLHFLLGSFIFMTLACSAERCPEEIRREDTACRACQPCHGAILYLVFKRRFQSDAPYNKDCWNMTLLHGIVRSDRIDFRPGHGGDARPYRNHDHHPHRFSDLRLADGSGPCFILGAFSGGVTAWALSAITMNIPGTAAAVATIFDAIP
jgi:hypothetical protein